LMSQFQTLRETCQNLTLDAQQKAGFESQVQELTVMNQQWQQAHQVHQAESETLRQKAAETHQLKTEVTQLKVHSQASVQLQDRVELLEGRIISTQAETQRLQDERQLDQGTIHRLHGIIESMHEDGSTEAGLLETELLERNREATTLRRELEEQRRNAEDLVRFQKSSRDSQEASNVLRQEMDKSQADLGAAIQERDSLNTVVERCVEKLEKESRERPFLVDKRMVTQMLASFLEQRNNPSASSEIMAKMADILGFTTAEREQVGLAKGRKKLLELREEPVGLAQLGDLFGGFLMDESEAG